jgi:hypothetical protein
MPAGQCPSTPDMGAGQGASQRLPGPPHQRHHEGGGHNQAVGVGAAELSPNHTDTVASRTMSASSRR